jgi:hypothetical protein
MNKQLALGVVAALLMAGGQANAQSCPTTPQTLASLIVPGLTSCTIGDVTFSNFRFTLGASGNPATSTVTFSADRIVFAGTGGAPNGATSLGTGTSTFEFNVAVAPTAPAVTLINGFTLGVTGGTQSTGSALITGLTVSGVGPVVPPSNGSTATSSVSFGASDELTVMLAGTQPASGTGPGANRRLDSLSGTFATETTTPVPEPSSLSLFGLGLVGLALARRRRS